jgi:hypothetical protein
MLHEAEMKEVNCALIIAVKIGKFLKILNIREDIKHAEGLLIFQQLQQMAVAVMEFGARSS